MTGECPSPSSPAHYVFGDVFLAASAATKLCTASLFVFVLRRMHRRRLKAAQGDQAAAKRVVLPCFKPLLRTLATLSLGVAVLHGVLFATPLRCDFESFYAVQGLSFLSVAAYAIAPVLLLQRSVSATAFWRTGFLIAPWALFCLGLWALQLAGRQAFVEWLFLAASVLPPVVLYVLMLSGRVASRIQLKSSSNKSCVQYALAYTGVYACAAVLGTVAAPLGGGVAYGAAALTCVMLAGNLVFPLAVYRTLLADTKYWRGLGRHNRGGMRIGAEARGSASGGNAAALGVAEPGPEPGTGGGGGGGVSGSGGGPGAPDAAEDSGGGGGGSTNKELDAAVASHALQGMLEVHQSVLVDFAFLAVGRYLGKGSTADVFRGELRGAPVAIKVFKPHEVTPEVVATFAAEAAFSANLLHHNVVHFHGICVRPPQVAMVFELCARGNLSSLLRRHDMWTLRRRLEAAVDAARAIEFLHSRNIIHRDIKAENYFVTADWTVKLGDFGESTLRRASDTGRRMTIVGTVAHMAPELIKASKHYTDRVDIYSLAITLWEIWTGLDPFHDLNTFQVYKAVLEDHQRPPLDDFCPDGLRACMEWGWRHEPEERPSASQLADRLGDVLHHYLCSEDFRRDRRRRALSALPPTPRQGPPSTPHEGEAAPAPEARGLLSRISMTLVHTLNFKDEDDVAVQTPLNDPQP